MKEETKIIHKIMKKLESRFPNLLKVAREEFIGFNGKEILKNKHLGQFFYGWFLTEFSLKDGKRMICLAEEILNLSGKEKLILNNIKKEVPGFFKVLKIENKDFYLLDLLTNKKYLVKTIDLEPTLEENQIIEASLIKNFEDNYFFFGGIHLRDSSTEESIKINLLEYTRDWTIEEALKFEMGVIRNLGQNKAANALLLENYLKEIFDMNKGEIKEFIDSDEEMQKAILKEIISEHNLLMTEGFEWEAGEDDREEDESEENKNRVAKNELWENKTKINGVWVDDETGEVLGNE